MDIAYEPSCSWCGRKKIGDRYWYLGRDGTICDTCNTEYAVFREFVVESMLDFGGHIQTIQRRVLV